MSGSLYAEVFDTVFDCSAPLDYPTTFLLAYLARNLPSDAPLVVRHGEIGYPSRRLFEEFFPRDHPVWAHLRFEGPATLEACSPKKSETSGSMP
jgi:hypothetical protein